MSATGPSYALIGSAGYIAPRHLQAMKASGGRLLATLDPHDSVGVLDSYFPDARYFREFERFDRHVDKLRRAGNPIDYVAVCSPNYLHDSHIRFALRSEAHVICEKPLVLNPWNIDAIQEMEAATGRRVNTVLQLRLHPSIIELKRRVDASPSRVYDVDLAYVTSRGHWYLASWKGDEKMSGGIATNIGIHFFDMLHFVFGEQRDSAVHVSQSNKMAGYLELERARVRWFLSIDRSDLPSELAPGVNTYRSLRIGDDEFEFSQGFTDLHQLSYQAILENRGFNSEDARASIVTVADIRGAAPLGLRGEYHPFLNRIL